MSDPQHLRLVEALVFASAKPLEENELVKRLPEGIDVATVLEDLSVLYAGRGVNLVRRGDGWAFRTAVDLGAILGKEVVVSRKLPKAAAETLAILAYQKGGQGVTRAEIEEIRGVSVSQGTLDLLFEAGWVRPLGRKEAPGRPMLWGTTEVFLDHFGLKSLDDLPGIDELKASGLLDTNPAMAYAARAHEDVVPGEEPVEPLGDGEDQAATVPVNGHVNGGDSEEATEEALERAALADEMLDTPEAEADDDDEAEDDEADIDEEEAASDADAESDGDSDDDDEDEDGDDEEDEDTEEDEDFDSDDGEDEDDDEDDDPDPEDEETEDRDESDTESAAAEK
ncbi:MAG TPA: SMC-Scp complex subunit ScpB [Magnetospirillaceae bacterium]|jgi:segregation and condensation protein B